AAGQMKHGVVILSPEIAFRHRLSAQCLWRNKSFTSRLISCVWDEAHCIVGAGHLRNMLPPMTPYYIPSATLGCRHTPST
ncbi:hypothetical protein C8Q80DRAFT_1113871, partial [Daedaleopsis nitida]